MVTDPVAYVLSANIYRRLMSKGAMALAMIAPEPDGRGKGKSKILLFCEGDERNAMPMAVNKARLILKYKSNLAQEVLGGMLQLDPAAYKKALVSIGFKLQSRGLTQREIADKLRVGPATVNRWLFQSGGNAEMEHEPELSDAEALDRIAKAMVAAFMFREPAAKEGRGKKPSATKDFPGVSPAGLSQARTVLELAPDLVDEVKTGAGLARRRLQDGGASRINARTHAARPRPPNYADAGLAHVGR